MEGFFSKEPLNDGGLLLEVVLDDGTSGNIRKISYEGFEYVSNSLETKLQCFELLFPPLIRDKALYL